MNDAARPAGNYYDKYQTRNPIARYLMNGFLGAFDELSGRVAPGPALEVGCGEGELSIRLARRGFSLRACDISADIVDEARRRATQAGVSIAFSSASLESLAAAPGAGLVVCCEVLEHLDDPQAGLDVLAQLAQPYLIASVPREPLWRVLNMARGKYLADFGNTPGHLQHWGQKSFVQFLSRRFHVRELRAPLPWTMALCERR
jgi:2-polyprenyl-3-methyl-5-hydroxy-6-metoxy-1,4-benzoquinol methylase